MRFTKEKGIKIGYRILRIAGWIGAIVFALLLLIALLIQVPAVQQYIKQKAVTFLSDKIGTKVELEHISLSIPKKVVLEGIYVEDQKKDTLLYVGEISVDTDLFALLSKRIELNSVSIDDLNASVTRNNEGVFNFDYIIKAFADSSATPVDTTKKAWSFALESIELNCVAVTYKDAYESDDIELKLENLALTMDEFDLERSRFYVNNFLLTGVDANISQGNDVKQQAPSTTDKDSAQDDLDFKINGIDLQKINIKYSKVAKQEITLNLEKASLEADNINLEEKKIELDEFTLDNTFITYYVLQSGDSSVMIDEDSRVKQNAEEQGWQFSLQEIALNNTSFQYYDFNQQRTSSGIDFNHLWVSSLDFEAQDISVTESAYSIEINEFGFHERSGFDLLALKGVLAINDQTADLEGFLLQTTSTKLQLDLHGEFASLEKLKTDYPEMRIEGDIRDSYIGLCDISFFVPGWSEKIPLKISPQTDVHIDSRIQGNFNDLQIEEFKISALKETLLQAHGTIKGLPDIKRTFFDIDLQKFYTTSKDIKSILADTLLPSSILFPDWVDLSGDLSGTIDRPSVKTTLNSDFGSVQLDVKTDVNSSSPKYAGAVAVNEFALGKLLKNEETIGALDLDASFNGAGLTKEDHQVKFRIDMNSFGFKGYTYKDFIVDGNVSDYLFTGKASMHDPNLTFEFDGDIDYNFKREIQTYHFDFDLVNADFKALHLTERPLKARFSLTLDLKNANLEDLNGDLKLHHVAIYNGEELYKVDSLLVASLHDEEKTELSIQSNIINGKLSGSFDLLHLPSVIKGYLSTYYSLNDPGYYLAGRPQQFSFDLKINNTALLTDVLVPDLKRFVPGEIKGEFDSEKKKLDATINIDEIEYGSISAQGLKFNIISDENSLDYDFETGQISISVVNIPSLDLKGMIEDNTITTELAIYDSLEKERYIVGGVLTRSEEIFKFHLYPDKVMLDYDKWQVPRDNFITIDKAGISTADFSLSNNEQRIEVKAQQGENSYKKISLHQLQLATLVHMALSQDTLIHGTIQGEIVLQELNNAQLLNADITINDVVLSRSELGNIRIKANQPTANDYNFDVAVRGAATQVDIKGDYSSKDSIPQANVDAKITSLDLAAIEPMLLGEARNMSGNLTGQMKLSGKTNDPVIDGRLTFKKVSLTPTYINTKILLEDETITFNQNAISLSNFDIMDERNNPLTLNGKIGMDDKQDYTLDLTANAKNFLMLNTKEGANDLFFGKLIIDAGVKVKGTASHPDVEALVSMGDDSNFTYVVPQDDKGVMEQKGVVKFVDRDVHKDPFLAAVEKEARAREDSVAFFQGITLTAKIELNDKETLNILIDPVTGDKLTVKGNSTLTLDIDPTGNMDLTGRYELTSGSYGITFYKLMKRDFEIQKGSTITWSGDPLNADLDITGIFNVETSPAELLQSQGTTQEDQTKQRLPFIVYLNVKGKILTPEISFSLDMPEAERGALGGSVYAKLQDINTKESDLNKQVFALLILKRFIADNPFESEGGGAFENTARTSVSRFLTEQLNQMSQNINGVELTFDLTSYEDNSNGESANRTQLELGLSKNLFSDRLVVKLSGNVDLEGGEQGNQNFSDYIGDLALEYKVTEDGRLRVTGFYNSNYDMIDGELKETGAGLIYVKDYDTLRELFKSNDKKK